MADMIWNATRLGAVRAVVLTLGLMLAVTSSALAQDDDSLGPKPDAAQEVRPNEPGDDADTVEPDVPSELEADVVPEVVPEAVPEVVPEQAPEQEAETTPEETAPVVPDASAERVAALIVELEAERAALAQCRAGQATVAQAMVTQSQDVAAARAETAALQEELSVCQTDLEIQTRTNIGMDARLRELEAGGASSVSGEVTTDGAETGGGENVVPAPTEDVAALQVQLDEAEQRAETAERQAEVLQIQNRELVAQLQAVGGQLNEALARLETMGISAQPGFSYFGGSSSASFVTIGQLRGSNVVDLVPEAEACVEIIAWLREQPATREARPLRLEVWVREPAGFAVCSAAAGGTTVVGDTIQSGGGQAHVVLFQ